MKPALVLRRYDGLTCIERRALTVALGVTAITALRRVTLSAGESMQVLCDLQGGLSGVSGA
jgi:hypothetical protein